MPAGKGTITESTENTSAPTTSSPTDSEMSGVPSVGISPTSKRATPFSASEGWAKCGDHLVNDCLIDAKPPESCSMNWREGRRNHADEPVVIQPFMAEDVRSLRFARDTCQEFLARNAFTPETSRQVVKARDR